MKRIKLFLSIVILIFILGFFPRLEAASTGSSNGEAMVANSPPEVIMLLVEPNRTDTYYNITFTVADNNMLSDLAEITVTVWDKATSAFNAPNNETNHYTFKWNPATGWFEENLTGHLVDSTKPNSFNVETATWSIKARFTSRSMVGNYTVKVVATDNAGASGIREAHLIRDKLNVMFQSNAVNPYRGQNVTISIIVTRLAGGSLVSNFIANVTKDGILWKSNVSDAIIADVEYNVASHTYNISEIIDLEYNLTDFEVTPLTISWIAGASGGFGGGTPYFKAEATTIPAVKAGEKAAFNITVYFDSLSVTVKYIDFAQNSEWFRILDPLPATLNRGQDPIGKASITVELTAPHTAGEYRVPYTVYASAAGVNLQAGGLITLRILEAPPAPPSLSNMGDPTILLLLIASTAALATVTMKKRR